METPPQRCQLEDIDPDTFGNIVDILHKEMLALGVVYVPRAGPRVHFVVRQPLTWDDQELNSEIEAFFLRTTDRTITSMTALINNHHSVGKAFCEVFTRIYDPDEADSIQFCIAAVLYLLFYIRKASRCDFANSNYVEIIEHSPVNDNRNLQFTMFGLFPTPEDRVVN